MHFELGYYIYIDIKKAATTKRTGKQKERLF
jgi:hypothetical protein